MDTGMLAKSDALTCLILTSSTVLNDAHTNLSYELKDRTRCKIPEIGSRHTNPQLKARITFKAPETKLTRITEQKIDFLTEDGYIHFRIVS